MNVLPTNDKELIKRLKEIILLNLSDENFGPAELAAECGISRSGLFRRLKRSEQVSISQFIRGVRLEKAKELLLSGQMTISEVAYTVGFSSPAYFNKCFHDHYGFPPGEVRHQTMPLFENIAARPEAAPEVHTKRPLFNNITLFAGWMILLVMLGWSLHSLFNRPAAEKTIAVLPFVDESPAKDQSWILTGLRSEIMLSLGSIEGMTIVSPITSEQYHYAGKSSKEIGRDLKADYLLSGNAQNLNGTYRVLLYLIDADKDRQVWVKPSEQGVNVGNMLNFRKDVALAIADELGVTIASGEKKKIMETVRPKDVTSYTYYLKGNDIVLSFVASYMEEPMREGKRLLELSLKYDSTFAPAYVALGWYYNAKAAVYFRSGNLRYTKRYCDTVQMMVDRAIHFDPKNRDAYALKSDAFTKIGMYDKAIEAAKTTIRLDPDNADSYRRLGYGYFMTNRLAEAAQNDLTAFKLNKEPLHNKWNLDGIRAVLRFTGYFSLAEKYAQMLLAQENDSNTYYAIKITDLLYQCRPIEALELAVAKMKHMTDTSSTFRFLDYARYYMYSDNFDEMNRYFHLFLKKAGDKAVNIAKSRFTVQSGYMFRVNGYMSEADSIFESCIRGTEELREQGHQLSVNGVYEFTMADTYAAWGKPEKSLEYLQQLLRFEAIPLWIISWLKMYPEFDTMRQMPEFQALMAEFEARYQREREKVKKVFLKEGIRV